MEATTSVAGRLLPARLTRVGAVLLVAAAALFAYYAWTASSSGNPFDAVTPFQFKYGDSDYSNLQADAFLHGRLSLDVPVDPALAAAANPYDPAVPGFRLPDASFYDDKYYLTWGPAPALTTFLPVRLVGLELRENLAIVLYAFIGVLFAWALLALVVRRLVADAPRSAIWLGNATLALGGALPWILRRPAVYEVAITAGFCFVMAATYVLCREAIRPERPRTSRLAIAGTLYGLAVLSRPTMGLVALAMIALAYLLRHDGRMPRALTATRRRALALVLGIPVGAGVLFLAYNAARFSGPLDFGGKYQFGGRDARDLPFNDPANLVPSLFGYLVAPLRIGLEFPYVHLPPPPTGPFHGPQGFIGEPTASLLWAVPFVLLALGVLGRWLVGRRRGAAALPPLVPRAILALLAASALTLLSGAVAIPGYTERYELDFLPYLLIAAATGWALLIRSAPSPRGRRAWRALGAVLAAWGLMVGVAIGFTGYYDSLKTGKPSTFEDLERFFSPLPTLVTAIAGHPIISGLQAPGGVTPASIGYTTLGPGNATAVVRSDAPARMTIVSPGDRDVQLRFTALTDQPGRFVVTATADDRPVGTTVANAQPAALPIRLHRGVNYVPLAVARAPGQPAAPDGAPVSLNLQGLRLQ